MPPSCDTKYYNLTWFNFLVIEAPYFNLRPSRREVVIENYWAYDFNGEFSNRS